jgi:cyclic pyranopterin phosphate synthase
LKDKFGREIEYLRISVTQECNLHCLYCNPDVCSKVDGCGTGLTPQEIGKIVTVMAGLGVHKVRITGGEPLLRADIIDIVKEISSIPQIDDISMTTNGIKLAGIAKDLKKAGLHRLSISMDSLQEKKFRSITGGGELEGVLDGVYAALEAGLHPVRLNAVLIRGLNDDEIDDFIQFASDTPVDFRFIELMPVGEYGEKNKNRIVFNSDIIAAHPELIPCKNQVNGQPARYFKKEGMKGRIGFISPMSHKFCSSCNRIRLTCDGKLKPCLGNNHELDITQALNSSKEDLEAVIKKAIFEKPAGHCFETGFTSDRKMSGIGG